MSAEDWRSLPHYVYVMRDATGTCLYVGCTMRPHLRLRDHIGGRAWWADVAAVQMWRFPNMDAGLTEERRLIQAEQPRYNRVYTDKYTQGGWATRRRNLANAQAVS